MIPEIWMMLALVASPLVILCIHMVFSRTMRGSSPQMVAVKSAVTGYLPVTAFLWKFVFSRWGAFPDTLSAVVYSFVVYTSLAYTYFHFFNTSETARRIRILYEIYRNGSLTSAEMMSLYQTSEIVSIRLERLVAMGQLRYERGYYCIDGRILYWAARMVLFWREMLGLNRSAP